MCYKRLKNCDTIQSISPLDEFGVDEIMELRKCWHCGYEDDMVLIGDGFKTSPNGFSNKIHDEFCYRCGSLIYGICIPIEIDDGV